MKSQAEKLSILLKLDVDRDDDSGQAKLRIGGDEPASTARELGDAVEKTAKLELSLAIKMQKARKKLDRLEKIGEALEGSVDGVFRRQGMGKASEVRKNVGDARELIKLMQARATDVHGKADDVVGKLAEAANADLDAPKTDTESAVADSKDPPKAEEPKTDSTATKPLKSKTVDTEKPKAKKHHHAATKSAPPAPKLGDFEP